MPPIIGLTTWQHVVSTALGEKTVIAATTVNYIDQVIRAGGTPVLLPGTDPTVLASLDGLVVCGGGDIDPDEYGEANDGSSDGILTDADSRDISFLRAAAEMLLPTLGVCRGLQAINVAAGGTLEQHVLGTEEHPELSESIEMNNDFRQRVTTRPGSVIAELYGDSTEVNSLHHQGVKLLAPGLRVTATTDDGMVEALEGSGEWPVLGVQWHPEELGDHGALIFQDLIARAREYQARRQDF
jgi:putative glutamine amidotransferase